MDEVRKQFEAWAVGLWLARDSSGDYISRDAQRAWGIWVPAFTAGATSATAGTVLVNTGDSEAEYIASSSPNGTSYRIGAPLSPEAATQALRDQGVIVDLIDPEQARDEGFNNAIRYVLGYFNGTGDCGSTAYDEILEACDRAKIIRSAVENGELEFTGLGRWVEMYGTDEERALIDAQAK